MHKIKKLTYGSLDYPPQLINIPSPPKVLWASGNLELLKAAPKVAVVGSRKVTQYGRTVTERVASELARAGVSIVSGMALGVDAIAHRAAIEAGGETIAVLPSGLTRPYPAAHAGLAKDILAHGGTLLSEYPPDEAPGRQNFIARNRIVSGLSNAVLITEAAAKSGTLHTANFALSQGRAVWAVPGNITSQLSEGTNNLIKSGAQILTLVSDLLDELGVDPRTKTSEVLGNTAAETAILSLIVQGVTDGTRLLAESKLSAADYSQTLSMLEITGRIKPLGADHWSLRS